MVKTLKPTREELQPEEVLCDYCTGKCCRYFALPIDKPKTRGDFEFIRWYMIHGDTTVFTDEGTWYLMVHADCRHLGPDNRCGIYMTRPQICRDYTTKDCEYDDDWVYDQYIETPEQIAEYADAVLSGKDDQCIRSPRPELLPVLS